MPLAVNTSRWLIGVPWSEAPAAGALLGVKTVLNEFVAYLDLARLSDATLSLRSRQWMERAMTRLNREIPVWPKNQRQKRVYTRMVADLFHEGHINFLRAARALGTHLTVCVVSDERVVENKGKLPVMKQAERAAVVAACKYVDAVMTETPASVTPEFMQQHGFDIYTFACASERERQDKYKLCESLPPEIIQELPYTPGISTSDLVARILDGAGSKEKDQ